MDHMAIIRAALDFEETVKSLGYDSCWLSEVLLEPTGDVVAKYYVDDDFQKDIDYKHRCQNSFLRFTYPFKLTNEFTREERELRVLLSQQGETVGLQSMLVSAAGRKFVAALQAERSKYAQLVDFNKGRDDV